MEELATKIQEKYIDDITSKYPIYRFFCLFMYLLSFYIYYVRREERLIPALAEIKVSYLFDFSEGLFSEISVFHLMIAIISTLLVARLSGVLKSLFFNFFSSLRDFDAYALKLKTTIEISRSKNIYIAWALSADISKQLEVKRVKLRSKQSISEVALTLLTCMVIGIKNLSIVDLIIIIGCVIIIFFSHFESFKVYVSEFMPYYVAEQTLFDKNVSFNKGNDELNS